MPTTLRRVCALIAGLALALTPTACGSGLSGTYADESGLGQLEFREDGTVYLTTFGGTIACTYEIDGDHVIVKGPRGTQVLTRTANRLDGGLGFAFVKR
jgi:hypothetical protein